MTDAYTSALLLVGDKDEELAALLDRELTAFNNAAVGVHEERSLSVRVTGPDGAVIAGLTGWTWGTSAGISMVWVHADHRRDGWGGRLLAAAEDEARVRGCDRISVSSFTFQAPEFYRRHGYVATGRTEGYPGDVSDVHFWKRLDGPTVAPRLRLVAVVDYPAGHEQTVQRYEDDVLALLPRHGGLLEQRLRGPEAEVHVISFASRAGLDAYLADPDRAELRAEIGELAPNARVLTVTEV